MGIERNVSTARWWVDKAAIKATWEMFDDGDISTERLLQLVADACDCTVSDVVDAIAEDNKEELI